MEEARLAQGIQDTYGEQGFQYITALHAAWSSPPTDEELVAFAAEYDHRTVPALSVPEEDQAYPDSLLWRTRHDIAGGWVVHLGADMAVRSIGVYDSDPSPWLE